MSEHEVVWLVVFDDWLDQGWENLKPGQVLGVFTSEALAKEFEKRYIEAHPGVDQGYKCLDVSEMELDKLEMA